MGLGPVGLRCAIAAPEAERGESLA